MKSSNQEMQPLHDLSTQDAIDILIADHKRVSNLFAAFTRLTGEGHDKERGSVVRQICQELTVHTQLEEELFYPAVRKATKDDDQIDEALVEHAGAKQLISKLTAADPGDDLYDARVTVLQEQIDHHVEEEEGSMFPKARYSGVNTLELGAALLARRSELMSGYMQRDAPATVTGEAVRSPNKRGVPTKRVSPKRRLPARTKGRR